MKRLATASLLGLLLVGPMGASHCEEGDKAAFGWDQCFATFSVDGIRGPLPVPVVEARRGYSGLFTPAEVRVEVNTCGASLTRIVDGVAEHIGPARFDPTEVRELHDALAEAGAGEIVGYTDCLATTGHDTRTEITFFEPSLVEGRVWANRFGFGNCGLEPRAGEVVGVLSEWVTEHFGPNLF